MTREEFWPYYLSQHLHPVNRRLHFIGTTFGLACLAVWLLTGRPFYFLAALLGSYGFAWAGHFFFEKNKPATFHYPLLSFQADFRMYALMWRGGCGGELARLGLSPKA
jgi:hypothetical protein